MNSHRKSLGEGFRDGVPIGLGYLAVSFSLGVAAKQAGLTAVQGFFASLLICGFYRDRRRRHLF